MAAVARRVREEGNRLEEAVRARAVRLARRAAVEVPQRQLVECRLSFEVDDLRLAAQVRDGLVDVQPDVLELELHLAHSWFRTTKNSQRLFSPEAHIHIRQSYVANVSS